MHHLERYVDIEYEANAMTLPNARSHHFHIPRGVSHQRIMTILEKESLKELEAGQNFWPTAFEEYFPRID